MLDFLTDTKRITVVTGHFGSGKTEFAINYALALKDKGFDVLIIDFDIVNPYYRTKDAESYLNSKGIEVIAPDFANSNIETPTLPPDILKAFDDKSKHIIFDVGGDEDGAVPLGVYNDRFTSDEYNMYFVLNERRMLTGTVRDALEIYENIENASRLKFTGIVNNTHIMQYTDYDTVINGQKLAEEFAQAVQLPLVCTCVSRKVLDLNYKKFLNINNIFPIDRFVGPEFILEKRND